ncbi:MAG: 2-phosphosulfolactate phosphatase [Acidobacteria bacterium]|nr:MAG: 2-phosphosulfolactate phosphatase [Acidobacteriota bacterium]
MNRIVVIDAFPESVLRYRKGWGVVAVEVIRATTTAVTAALSGRRCFPVASTHAAFHLTHQFNNPLLAGELDGEMPGGFEMNDSPSEIAMRTDVSRPLILLSSSGTRLIVQASRSMATFLACFRNYTATARHLIKTGLRKVALIGAGYRGEFREEDQLCCAWIAAALLQAGYLPKDSRTVEILNRWSQAPVTEMLSSKSVEYLRRTRQLADLDFILKRIDDVKVAVMIKNGEIVPAGSTWRSTVAMKSRAALLSR